MNNYRLPDNPLSGLLENGSKGTIGLVMGIVLGTWLVKRVGAQ